MGEIFAKCDVDGSGNLSISEFRKCCEDADIGLTKREINVLMLQCDVDGDGSRRHQGAISSVRFPRRSPPAG